MDLPKIDISSLPHLDKLTGMFGSLTDFARAASSDDSLVMLMVFLYEIRHG